jgi:predicted DNA-binding transcriptional regulator AlpA
VVEKEVRMSENAERPAVDEPQLFLNRIATERLLSLKECAAKIGCSTKILYGILAADPEFPAIRFGGYRFDWDDVLPYLKEHYKGRGVPHLTSLHCRRPHETKRPKEKL